MKLTSRILAEAEVVGELIHATRSGASLPIVAPQTESEFVEIVQRAVLDKLVLLPIGNGSKLGWAGLATHADIAISTRRLAGVVAHEPDDGTITALAGTRFDELWTRARTGGHHLSPDVPYMADATLGGVIAAGQSGVDRLRFGPLRNQLLGTRVLLANGMITKSGGRLVKNVTGFDLHRLYCGSHGSLCILLEASLRLHSAPEARCHVVLDVADVSAALSVAHEIQSTRLAPWTLAIDAEDMNAPAHVHLELAGRESVVSDERASLPPTWRAARSSSGSDAEALHDHYAAGEADPRDASIVRITARPSQLAAVLKHAAPLLNGLSALRYVRIQPALASIDLFFDRDATDRVARLAQTLRGKLSTTTARVQVAGDARLRKLANNFDEVGPALAWMRKLRQQFDPHGVLATGRGPGGL